MKNSAKPKSVELTSADDLPNMTQLLNRPKLGAVDSQGSPGKGAKVIRVEFARSDQTNTGRLGQGPGDKVLPEITPWLNRIEKENAGTKEKTHILFLQSQTASELTWASAYLWASSDWVSRWDGVRWYPKRTKALMPFAQKILGGEIITHWQSMNDVVATEHFFRRALGLNPQDGFALVPVRGAGEKQGCLLVVGPETLNPYLAELMNQMK